MILSQNVLWERARERASFEKENTITKEKQTSFSAYK
jgi:hypothetical protein